MKQSTDIISHRDGIITTLEDVVIPGLARDQSISIDGSVYIVQAITHEVDVRTTCLYTTVYVTQV